MTAKLALNSSVEACAHMAYLASKDLAFQNTSGTVRGEPDRARSFGELPRFYWKSAECAEFTVYSYDTPIAWRIGDAWSIPNVEYSSTTSKHQGFVRSWIAR